MKGYKTSKDFKHLKELLDAGKEVVCFITYDFNERHKGEKDYKPIITTDVCMARLADKGSKYENYHLSCRGTGFITYWTRDFDYKYTFEELCEAQNVEYIEPDES